MSATKLTVSVSNYAAPNTPIASAKRPRKSPAPKKVPNETNSPIAKSLKFKTDDSLVENSDDSTTSSTDEQTNVINTPSKVMFSPNLRVGETKSLEPLRRPQLPPLANPQDGDEDVEEFNPYLFMAQLPDHRLAHNPDKICLPPKASEFTGFHTLVLDLDETLVHCTVDPIPNADLIFPVNFNGSSYQVYVRKRPYLDKFLESVSKQFEVVLFTASQKIYADTLLNLLDPERKLIHHRLFREACLYIQGNFLKDLTVLDRDLKTTVIIDNSPHAYAYQPSNGIPIESWFDEDDDEELLKALSFLDELHSLDDVRSAVIDHFRTHELIEESRNQALLSANTTSNTSSSSTTAATANLNTSSSSGSSSSTSNITQALSRTIVSPNSPGGRMNGRRV